MAATFGGLNLEELGVVGEPEVEYARFETEVSEPRGYDGGVLANFRRGATTIKFNLALTGTRTEITNKLNALAAELAKGQQELILPTMTPGYHFDASANCALQPAQYIDGFVLPLEFSVPFGLAVQNNSASLLDGPVALERYKLKVYPSIYVKTNKDITVNTVSGIDRFFSATIRSTEPGYGSQHITLRRPAQPPMRYVVVPAGTEYYIDGEKLGYTVMNDTSGLLYSVEGFNDFYIIDTPSTIADLTNTSQLIYKDDMAEATIIWKGLSVW